ncbi:MAG: hypothetical protein R3E87_19420 [Burkholderiaceae bacterium]
MQACVALHVDRHVIDDELRDVGSVGPEFAHLADVYCRSPRAVVFHAPSSEWRLFIVLLPLVSRLSLMTNPIFTQLVRAWGLNLRVIGVDRNAMLYDFRSLLSDRMLAALIDWLVNEDQRELPQGALAARRVPASPEHALDLLFATLAGDMLTVLEKRRDDWGRHLDVRHRLEPGAPASLFDRTSRLPDFMNACRQALRDAVIDVPFYGRVLRSIDEREELFEQRAMRIIADALDAPTLERLERAGVGHHLGCYNWLRIAPNHAGQRTHILERLPAFAASLAETLLGIETLQIDPGTVEDLYTPLGTVDEHADRDQAISPQAPAFDLAAIASGSARLDNLAHAWRLKQAVDTGQDRAIIEALAARFEVTENTIRLLWHDKPEALGQPPTWHLAEILRRLDALPRREWPGNTKDWEALITSAIPATIDG